MADQPRLLSLEFWNHRAPLGIRFWDQARDVAVSAGLEVTARPLQGDGSLVRALCTGAGVYAFFHLPGLHAFEQPDDPLAPDAISPPAPTRPFLIKVTDRPGRFLPAALVLDLPLTGSRLFPAAGPRGFYLFDAPTRIAQTGFAALRGQLWDRGRDAPAAFAVLQVDDSAGKTWYGVADARGCIALTFPYPALHGTPGGSPPHIEVPSLYATTWQVTLQVRYAAAPLARPAGSDVPDLRDILGQPAGLLWPVPPASPPGAAQASLSLSLQFGQECILRSGDDSRLFIDPRP